MERRSFIKIMGSAFIALAARQSLGDAPKVADTAIIGNEPDKMATAIANMMRASVLELTTAEGEVLVSIPFDFPAFTKLSEDAIAIARPITGQGIADGIAKWGRVKDFDGVTLFEMTVGMCDSQLNVSHDRLFTGANQTIHTLNFKLD